LFLGDLSPGDVIAVIALICHHMHMNRPDPEVWLHPELWHNSGLPEKVGGVALANEVRGQFLAAQCFEHLIDPNNTLPRVVITPNVQDYSIETPVLGYWQIYDIWDGEQQIGYFNLSFDELDDKAYFAHVMLGVDQDLHRLSAKYGGELSVKGKGYGLATYKSVISEALVQGYGFKSHELGLSFEGHKIWQKLEAKGVAKMVDPGVITNNGKVYSYTTARFEIHSNQDLIDRDKAQT
jgi:hypothetical protein